ncbi:MAG: polyprenyl synthetase family protein [Myxococcales bacterium]|nr:polyprenyl synthetase family protein [Myxococcales bacterium]
MKSSAQPVAQIVHLAPEATLTSTTAMPDVEEAMLRLAVGVRPEFTGAMVCQHLSTGGKRLRARLALAAAAALGIPRQSLVPWAAAVEVLHNATLAHDDIQDGDWLRRDEPTLWVRHGLGQAINAGDLMLMLPTIAVADLDVDDATRWALAHALAVRSAATVRGQSQEMALLEDEALGWSTYIEAVDGKTGQLLALPVEGAALVAGRSVAQSRALADAFRTLGVLFQLRDDLLDLYADKGRVPGGDLREGKVSALVVAHLELHPNSTWLLELLRTPAAHTSDDAIEAAIASFVEGGAVQRVLERIEELGHEVRTSPILAAEPHLHGLALELADWIAAKAPTPVLGAPPARAGLDALPCK